MIDAVIAVLKVLAGYLPMFRKSHKALAADLEAEKAEAVEEATLYWNQVLQQSRNQAGAIIERHANIRTHQAGEPNMIGVELKVDARILSGPGFDREFAAEALGDLVKKQVIDHFLKGPEDGDD